MNNILQQEARQYLKDNLATCTEAQQFMFKRMYSHKDLTKNIDEVVDDMPEDSLDRAMQQVERTVNKNQNGVE